MYITIQGGRGDTTYCAIEWAMKAGVRCAQTQGCVCKEYLLIRAQKPLSEAIPCKGQPRRGEDFDGQETLLIVAGRSARRGDRQGGAGVRRRALPARVWRTAARCGLSVWRHHYRESVVGRPEGAQPPNTSGGNTTRGETAHGETHPPTPLDIVFMVLFLFFSFDRCIVREGGGFFVWLFMVLFWWFVVIIKKHGEAGVFFVVVVVRQRRCVVHGHSRRDS